MDCQYRISIKGLVLDETRTKFLLTLEESGEWELPGGGLDYGETPDDCLRREIREEAGLEVSWVAAQPSYFFTFERNAPTKYAAGWRSNLVYEARLKNLAFTPSDECLELKFVSPEEALQLHLSPNVRIFVKLFAERRI